MVKLTFVETRWHGCKYYAVEPYLTSWSVTENNNKWDEIKEWCYETFGEQGDVWEYVTARWYYNDRKFLFREESDRLMFVLKWL